MGCVVNGPGEASMADFGVAGGKGFGFIFEKGRPVRKVAERDLADELLRHILAGTAGMPRGAGGHNGGG